MLGLPARHWREVARDAMAGAWFVRVFVLIAQLYESMCGCTNCRIYFRDEK